MIFKTSPILIEEEDFLNLKSFCICILWIPRLTKKNSLYHSLVFKKLLCVTVIYLLFNFKDKLQTEVALR